MSISWTDRPVLSGRHVRLEPLTTGHAEGLLEAAKDPAIWRWLSYHPPTPVARIPAGSAPR